MPNPVSRMANTDTRRGSSDRSEHNGLPEGAASTSTPVRSAPTIEPLSFPEATSGREHTYETYIDVLRQWFPCALCDEQPIGRQGTLVHLLEKHCVIVADVHEVTSLNAYLSSWKRRLQGKDICTFATTVATAPTEPGGPGGEYFLLGPILAEDRLLRDQLQKDTLAALLEYQQAERANHAYSRMCLFCKDTPVGNRKDYLNHMLQAHGLSIGLPDNIVCVDKFLDMLTTQLDRLQCLYCEKTFKSREVLRAHMRKKKHLRINPRNKAYDMFYLVNYLEPGKGWEALQQEDDREDSSDDHEDPGWDEWQEEEGADTVCLFCVHVERVPQAIFEHMKVEHAFDFEDIRQKRGLDFYQCIKLLNYIRRQTHHGRCYVCTESFSDLLAHARAHGHLDPSHTPDLWDRPEYYFPTYENDPLLCAIDDPDDDPPTPQLAALSVTDQQPQ